MKLSRTNLFMALSSIALVAILFIQVNWLFRIAEIKEALFNEKANMVLTKTAEALAADKTTCRNMETYVGQNERKIIDSLLKHNMKFYNFHIDYSFEVNKQSPTTQATPARWTHPIHPEQPACYQKSLEEAASKSGLELKLLFPKKKQFIMAEMGTLFITSVILILVVLTLFWRTTLSLMKEKKLSDRTTDFLNNMTHELKTPLTNIGLAGKMILKDSNIRKDDKTKHYSEIILEENEKLRLQVEQVLSMTALERGDVPLYKRELDLHSLIYDCVKCLSIQIESKQGNLNLNLSAERYTIHGDKTHLTNAICNLIDNAIKYSGEKPELFIQTFNQRENVIVTIADKGIGIEKEHHEKVFDKFFRVPTGNVHDVKGFGLGLAYVKKILELHKGSIMLESEKEQGTTFTITLPNV